MRASTPHVVSLAESPAGVNVSGLEWNSVNARNVGFDIQYGASLVIIQDSFLRYLASINVTRIRVPVIWEALQPVLNTGHRIAAMFPYVKQPGDLHAEMVQILKGYLDACQRYGIQVVFDIHNYGKYYDLNTVGTGIGTLTSPRTTTFFLTKNAGVSTGTATFTAASTAIRINSGTLAVGEPITFTLGSGGALPPEVNTTDTYYVVEQLSTTTGAISSTLWGTPITFSTAHSGTINRSQPIQVLLRTFANGLLTQNHLADLFTRLVATFDSHPATHGYGLMNEVGISGGLTNSAWVDIANYAIAAIRTAGSTKKVYVDGPYVNDSITPYAASDFSTIVDPANNWQREIHWYLDANRSGAYFDWNYDVKRGFCVDVADQAGNVPQIGTVRGLSMQKATTLMAKPGYIGELGVPHTSDEYYRVMRDFVRITRQSGSDIALWGATQNEWFPASMVLRPYYKSGHVLPAPAVSTITADAGVEDAKLVTYVDVSANTLTIEGYGGLLNSVVVGISCSDPGVVLSASSVTLSPGVLSYQTITFTPPVAATATFSFTTSRPSLVAPAPVTVLNYTEDGSGSALHGQTVLQRTKSSVFHAGTGMSDFHSVRNEPYETVVPNAGLSDRRYSIDNLTATINGKIKLTEGLLRRKAWSSGKINSRSEYRADVFMVRWHGAPGEGQGLNSARQSRWQTRNNSFHVSVTFDRGSSNTAGTNGTAFGCLALMQGLSLRQAVGIFTGSVVNTLRIGVMNATYSAMTYFQATVPTVLAANTLYTATLVANDGVFSLYINGVLEVVYTEPASETNGASGTITEGLAGSTSFTVAATTGISNYSYTPVKATGIPEGAFIAPVAIGSKVCNLVDKYFNPVALTATATGATYRVHTYYDAFSLFGGWVNFYPHAGATSSNVRIYTTAYGEGSLSATECLGIANYFNGITNASDLTPALTASPVISGQPTVGYVLSVTTGTWSGTPSSYLYQWMRGSEPIPGATSATYTLVGDDAGHAPSVSVIAVNASGQSVPAHVGGTLVTSYVNTKTYHFSADTVGQAPADIAFHNSNTLSVVNTGVASWHGNYLRDTRSTAGTDVFTLTKFVTTAGAAHSIQWESNSATGFLLMPQAGTTVDGYPGLLQGYLFTGSSGSGFKIFKVTQTGITQIGVTQWPTLSYPCIFRVVVDNGRLSWQASYDKVRPASTFYTLVDRTFISCSGPIQLVTAVNGVPNGIYYRNLQFDTL